MVRATRKRNSRGLDGIGGTTSQWKRVMRRSNMIQVFEVQKLLIWQEMGEWILGCVGEVWDICILDTGRL